MSTSSYNELMSFIIWKLHNKPEYLKEILPQLLLMNEDELIRWAIRHDIIDA